MRTPCAQLTLPNRFVSLGQAHAEHGLILRCCTGGEIRTPINGFGDRYSTIELRP